MKSKYSNLSILLLSIIILSCKTPSLNESYAVKANQNEKYLRFQIDSLKSELDKLKQDFIPGKVYSRCSVPATFEVVKSTEKYNVYIGINNKQEGVSRIQILYKPAHTNWVKRNSSEICSVYKEKENEYCENWFFQEIAPTYKNLFVVIDTNKVKEFEFKRIDVERVVKESYLTDVSEFTCPTISTSNLVGRVQIALRAKGYSLEGAKE